MLSKKFLFAWKFLLKGLFSVKMLSIFAYRYVNTVRFVPIWCIRIGRYHNKTYIQFPSSTADDHCTKSNIKLISFIFFRWIHLFFSHLFLFVFDRITAALSCNFRVTFCITKRKYSHFVLGIRALVPPHVSEAKLRTRLNHANGEWRFQTPVGICGTRICVDYLSVDERRFRQ